jgi:LacI family kdg operon repressor
LRQASKQHAAVKPAAGRVTIAQVAREAGVSKTSVSRYLGGEFDALSEPLLEQIRSTIARLRYQPSQMARGLKRGRTRLIGMVVADILNPYSVAVLHGVEAACQKHGYTLMLCNTGNDVLREQQGLAALHSYSAEGLIFNTQGRNAQPIRDLEITGLPVVLLDRSLEGCDFDLVGLDNVKAAREATDHLLERGYDAIAMFIEPPLGVSARQQRVEGFRQSLAIHPAALGETIEVHLDQPGHLANLLQDFLKRHPAGRRIGLLAANGMVGLQLALALQSMRLRFPQDVGFLTFDEMAWSALVEPGISTLEQPTYELGFAALECLLRRINGETSTRTEILLPGRLIVRGSTDALAAD